AKGGALQLTMNSVYYLSDPIENIDYRYYLEFLPQEQRAEQLRYSYTHHSYQALGQTMMLAGSVTPAVIPGTSLLVPQATPHAVDLVGQSVLGINRRGRFSDYVGFTIPLCMGDYYGPFRVVGTTPDMFEVLPQAAEEELEFAAGRNMEPWNAEHGYFEAVVGATVAREMKIQLGDQGFPTRGDPEGHSHETGFRVVGILAATGSPQDRAVFINVGGFYLMGGHAKPIPRDEDEDEHAGGELVGGVEGQGESAASPLRVEQRRLKPLPLEQRELTSFLLR